MNINNRLNEKIALITGGAQGIGRAIAQLFAKHGAKIIVVDLSDKKYSNENYSDDCNYLKLDVSKQNSWQEISSFIKARYKSIDILINNAAISGINTFQDPENMSVKTWRHIHSINLTSVFLGCKFAINIMKNNQNQSSIINIASRSGIIAVPNLAAYSSTKAAVRNYTKAVATYCIQKGYSIRCNAISPAAIDTEMWDHYKKDKNIFDTFTSSLPLKRMGTAKEVAYAALYLASDESSYTTGSEVIIDGGILSTCINSPK